MAILCDRNTRLLIQGMGKMGTFHAKLSLEYCDTLVEAPVLRDAFFGTQFMFDQPVAVTLADPAQRDLIITPLIEKMLGVNLADQPTFAEVYPLIDALVDDLTAGCIATNCDAVRTRTVVKASCSAVLSSAAVHLQ